MVPFGPADDRLPARFVGVVEREDPPVKVSVTASFNGSDRVKVESVSVERTDGESVTPADMARLKPAAVIRSIVYEAMQPGWARVWFDVNELKGTQRPKDDALRAVARLYWLEYVAWASPRQAIMHAADLPRSTANRWIRKARDLYGLPGPHSGEED